MIVRPRRTGFTLVETLLAVGLTAMLLGLVASGIHIYTRIVSDRREDIVNAQVARVILQRIATDLRSAYMAEPPADEASASADTTTTSDDGTGDDGTGDDGTGDDGTAASGSDGSTSAGMGDGGSSDADAGLTDSDTVDATVDLAGNAVQTMPGIYGNLEELQVDMVGRPTQPIKYDLLTAAGVDPQSANLWSDPKVVTYYFRSVEPMELANTPLRTSELGTPRTVLMRRVQSRAVASYATSVGGSADTQSGEQFLSDQVLALSFSYFDGYEWLDSWDSAVTGGLPLAVKIDITVAEDATAIDASQELTTDNTFQLIVHLPTAEAAATDESATGGF